MMSPTVFGAYCACCSRTYQTTHWGAPFLCGICRPRGAADRYVPLGSMWVTSG